MPNSDEQNLNLINERKRAKVEATIEQNPIYKRITEVLKRPQYAGIKIDMEQMIDTYMDRTSTNANESIETLEIDLGLINEVIGGLIFSISHEENNLGLDSNGEMDVEASITQLMKSQYDPYYVSRYINGLGNLTPDELAQLSNSVREMIEEERKGTLWNKEDIGTFLWNEATNSEIDLSFLESIRNHNVTSEMVRIYLEEKVEEVKVAEKIENYEEENYIETQEELELVMLGVKASHSDSEDEKNAYIEELKNSEEAQKYRNPETGEIDVESALEAGKKWERTYTWQNRMKAFDSYTLYITEKGEKNDFNKLSFKDRDLILGSAIRMFEDKNAPEEYRKIAIGILTSINPELELVRENSQGEFELNDEAIISAYNGMREGSNIQHIDEIRKYYEEIENTTALGQLENIKEHFVSREEWEESQEKKKVTKEKLSDITKRIEERQGKVNKSKIIVFNSQKKLGMRLDATLDSFRDGDSNNKMGHDEKVNTVMAAYLLLKESTKFGSGMDIGNYAVNKQALSMIEEHIKNDPLSYGNYIDEITHDNGKVERRIKGLDNPELSAYKNENGKYNDETKQILAEIRQTALEKLYKESSLRDKLSKDGVEIIAEALKDGVKFFIKEGLNFALGESRAREVLDAVKGNEVYVGARNATYTILKGTYHAVRGVARVATKPLKPIMNLLPNGKKLALPSADRTLTLTDVEETVENAKNTNYIRNRNELELVMMGIDYTDLDSEQRQDAIKKIEKMPEANIYKEQETGKIDTEAVIKAGETWKKNYLNQKRAQDFLTYNDMRAEGKKFEKMSPEDQKRILRSVMTTIEDEKSSIQMQRLAGAILADISPKLVYTKEAEEGDFKLKIDAEKFKDLYNTTLDNQKLKKVSDLKFLLQVEEDQIVKDKLERLREADVWLTKDEWKEARKKEEQDTKKSRTLFGKNGKDNSESNIYKILGTDGNIKETNDPEVKNIQKINKMMKSSAWKTGESMKKAGIEQSYEKIHRQEPLASNEQEASAWSVNEDVIQATVTVGHMAAKTNLVQTPNGNEIVHKKRDEGFGEI